MRHWAERLRTGVLPAGGADFFAQGRFGRLLQTGIERGADGQVVVDLANQGRDVFHDPVREITRAGTTRPPCRVFKFVFGLVGFRRSCVSGFDQIAQDIARPLFGGHWIAQGIIA